MNTSMTHSFAFAKWILSNRNPDDSFESIIAKLDDHSIWDIFIHSDHFIHTSNNHIQSVIPQLLQNDKKNRVKKNFPNKGKKTLVDAQTSTDTTAIQTLDLDQNHAIIHCVEPVVKQNTNKDVVDGEPAVVESELLVKEPKKRGKKNTNKDVVESEPAVGEPLVKEPKKRGKKNTNKDVVDGEPLVKEPKKRGKQNTNKEVVDGEPAVGEPLVKEPKKRGKQNTNKEVVDGEPAVGEPLVKEPKKRGKKNTNKEVVDGEPAVVESEPAVGELLVKEPKKRGKKNTNKDVVDSEPAVGELLVKEPKKRGKQNTNKNVVDDPISPSDDIVIPIDSNFHIQLQTQEISLTEVFVNDVLFYTDNLGNWFDATLSPTNNPLSLQEENYI
jgi:hypothetical protein